MEHLSLESLSRCVDERPDDEAAAHLHTCGACREELEALREQTAALRSLPDLRPPVEDWDVLEARLISEGLVRRPGRISAKLAVTPRWMRAAAAVLLFVSGAAVGAGAAGTRLTPADAQALLAARVAAAQTSDEAAQWVRTAEQGFVDALLRHSQLVELEGGGATYSDPAARYAALDYLVTAGQQAVRQAPADPFLNGFLASAMAERQAVLRRISSGPDNWY